MKRSWKSYLLGAVILVGLVAGYSNCAPTFFQQIKSQGSSTVGNGMTPVANELIGGVCGTLTRCNPGVSYSQCENAMLLASGINSQIGLSASSYSEFSLVVSAEESGAIVGDIPSADGCYSAIDTLSCSSPQVQGAYNSGSSTPFANIAVMLPTQNSLCQSVYTQSNQTFAQMVQYNSQTGSGKNISTTNSNAQTQGNTNIVILSWGSATNSSASLTDTAGNHYTKINPSSPNAQEEIWYATGINASVAGANTFTATFNQVDPGPEITFLEYNGLGSAVDVAGTKSATNINFSESLTTTNSQDLILCFTMAIGNSANTIASPFNMATATGARNIFGTLDATSAGTYTCSGTQSGSGLYNQEMVAFEKVGTTKPPFNLQQAAGNNQSAQNPSVTMNAEQLAGDLNIVLVTWNDSVRTLTSVNDLSGNTYQLAAGPVVGTNQSGAIYYAQNITASAAGVNTVTAHFSGSTNSEVSILEYSGASTTSAVDQQSFQLGTGNTATTGNVTTHFANEILVSVIGEPMNRTTVPSSGFLWVGPSFGNLGVAPVYDLPAVEIVTSAGTYGDSFPLSASPSWVSLIATFH